MIFLFCFITNKILAKPETNFDAYVFDQLKKITNASNTKLMIAITFLGSRYFLFPTYIIVFVFILFIKKDFITAIFIAAIGAIGNEIWIAFQHAFHRIRPPDPLIARITDYSYPSGHSFSAFTFFGLMFFFTLQSTLKKGWKIILCALLIIIPCLVAVSRVYLHMHFVTDVIGGCCLAIAWLILSLSLLYFTRKRFISINKTRFEI